MEDFLSPFDRGEKAPKYEMDFDGAESLDRFGSYQFFTPAPAYLFGRLTDRVLIDFLDTYHGEGDPRLLYKLFDRNLFTGLQLGYDESWNRVLWAMEKEAWKAFEPYLLSAVFVDSSEKQVYRFGAQDLLVPDPLAPLVTPQSSRIPVVLLGVNSTKFRVAAAPRTATGQSIVEVLRFPPDPRLDGLMRTIAACDNPNELFDSLPPLPPPVAVQTVYKSIDTLDAEKRAGILKAIQDYRREFGR